MRRVAQWDSTLTPNWKVPELNPVDVLDQALEPNLATKIPVTFRSNKINCSD